mgnify:CR=1 FL=1
MAKNHHDYDALPTDKRAPSIRQEMRVVAVVVLFVIGMEIVARIMAPTIDSDREHIHAFPDIIDGTAKEAGEKKLPNVIFFGNSLMRAGLDEEIVADSLIEVEGPEIASAKITPVGTAMLDWVYLYKRYFEDSQQHPDILVVGFVAHHIHDQEPIKLRRLSRHFVAMDDFPELWSRDLGDFHRIAQSTLCHFSALEGDQPEHQLKLLSGIVSDYNNGLNRNNDLVRAAAERKAALKANTSVNTQTFSRMQRLIETCKKHGVEIWFVPMPQPEVWPLHPEAVALIERHGMKLLDAREIEGMTEEDFWDGYHLGDSGMEKFSQWMAGQIKILQPQ